MVQKIYTQLYLRYEPRIILQQLVNATLKVVKTLPDALCSSRDGVPRKITLADKPAYQKGSIDASFGPPPLPLDSTFKVLGLVDSPINCNSTVHC